MVVHRRKKHLKFRGHRMQGWGSHKKHRGGGSQGGKGKSGRHKHKWSYVAKYAPDTFGKHGFLRPQDVVIEVSAVNIRYLDEHAEKLVQEKIATREGDAIRIDAGKIGFDKVLGGGRVMRKLIIEAKFFSEEAKKKIEEAGGQAVVAQKKSEKTEKGEKGEKAEKAGEEKKKIKPKAGAAAKEKAAKKKAKKE